MTNRRTFRLPGIEDLTKEQESVLALPLDGQHLVVGGPGTGKSVVALLRARRLAGREHRYTFLVYNHLLNRANRQLFPEKLFSKTWHSWFCSLYRKEAGSSAPLLEDASNGSFKPIDWKQVIACLESLEFDRSERPHWLVIDEGQDMPPEFYRSLVEIGFEKFFVVADQNQQIASENSNRGDLEDVLGVETDDVIELHVNFRNSHPIALLARQFYTGDPAIPSPKLPRQGRSSTPILYRYSRGQYGRVIRRIVLTANNKPRRLVGLITPRDQIRFRYHRDLSNTAEVMFKEGKLCNGLPQIRTFSSSDRSQDVRFDRGGILVINVQACKGLEFDTVICADIDQFPIQTDDLDRARKLFYVMVARARKKVVLLQQREVESHVDSILPKDDDVLQRREI